MPNQWKTVSNKNLSIFLEDDKNFGNNPALLQWLGRDWRESRLYNGIMMDGMETIILVIFNCQFARRNYYGMQDRML